MVQKMSGLSIDLLTHPGETLQEVLDANGMTQSELASRIGVTAKHINEIIKGKKPISPRTADKLSNVFSLSARFWNNLQKIYDEELEAIMSRENIDDEEIEIVKKLPYQDLVTLRYIDDCAKNNTEKVLLFRKFLGITNLLNVDEYLKTNCLFRKSAKINYDSHTLAIWMKICELETKNIPIKELNLEKLKTYLPEIKSLMFEEVNSAINKIKKILSECGIAFAVVRNLRGAPVQGYIKKLADKIILCLTIRNKYSDIFWFTLFHELGHLFTSSIETWYLDFLDQESKAEEKANAFANKILIDNKIYKLFISTGNFSKQKIIEYAEKMKVKPGILVGRLQHDGYIRYNMYNDLRDKYEWA